MIALAEALGVTVDQLVGRAAPSGTTHTLEHRALLYATDEDFVDAAAPFVTAGLERSDAVLVVSAPNRVNRLRRALGTDVERVEFRPSAKWYSSPQRALDSFRAFLQESTGAGSAWVRIIGEPMWAGRSPKEIRAWTRYESMLNIALAAYPATIVCPYGTRSLSGSIVADARCTHPEVMSGPTAARSLEYCSPESFVLGH
jgi:hypothetical protein